MIQSNYNLVFNKLIETIKNPKGKHELRLPDIFLRFDTKDYIEFFHKFEVIETRKNLIYVVYDGEEMIFNVDAINLVAEIL